MNVLAAAPPSSRKEATDAAGKLSNATVQIERAVGEGDKLFGFVTAADIVEALAAPSGASPRPWRG